MYIALTTGPCSEIIVSTAEMRWIYCTGNQIIFSYNDWWLRPESMHFLSAKDAVNSYRWLCHHYACEQMDGRKRLFRFAVRHYSIGNYIQYPLSLAF